MAEITEKDLRALEKNIKDEIGKVIDEHVSPIVCDQRDLNHRLTNIQIQTVDRISEGVVEEIKKYWSWYQLLMIFLSIVIGALMLGGRFG